MSGVPAAITDADAHALAVCGDVLSAARPVAAFSRVLAIVAGGGGVVAGTFADAPAVPVLLFGAALATAVAAQWLAMRVRLDAALFGRLAGDARADRLDLAGLDAALTSLGLMTRDKAGRDVAARCRGALALVRRLCVAVVVEAALIVAGGIALAGSAA